MHLIRVESMGGIILRTSHLDPDVRLSEHPAPDILSRSFCLCGVVGGSFGGQLEGSFSSNCYGFRLHGADESFPH
ncbi:hypothetical protein [Lyngbya aestuarii]|uniref:hypothetical protein n=1 Tax=Lyngbya aestuarii TaxID=118322 RepID=UPI00403D558B